MVRLFAWYLRTARSSHLSRNGSSQLFMHDLPNVSVGFQLLVACYLASCLLDLLVVFFATAAKNSGNKSSVRSDASMAAQSKHETSTINSVEMAGSVPSRARSLASMKVDQVLRGPTGGQSSTD